MQLTSLQRLKIIRNCTFYLALYYFLKSMMNIYWLDTFEMTIFNFIFMVVLHTLCTQVIKIEQCFDLHPLTAGQRFLYGAGFFLVLSEVAHWAINLIA